MNAKAIVAVTGAAALLAGCSTTGRKVPQAEPMAQTIAPDLPLPIPAAAASPGFRRG